MEQDEQEILSHILECLTNLINSLNGKFVGSSEKLKLTETDSDSFNGGVKISLPFDNTRTVIEANRNAGPEFDAQGRHL